MCIITRGYSALQRGLARSTARLGRAGRAHCRPWPREWASWAAAPWPAPHWLADAQLALEDSAPALSSLGLLVAAFEYACSPAQSQCVAWGSWRRCPAHPARRNDRHGCRCYLLHPDWWEPYSSHTHGFAWVRWAYLRRVAWGYRYFADTVRLCSH